MKLLDYFGAGMSSDELYNYIDDEFIAVQKHPTADLYLYNYTPKCQIEKAWDAVTCKCRGIITDGDGNIVARPFEKFFNYEEIEDKDTIPSLPFKAYEKVDGSLGILYWIDDVPYIATRGSFRSEQAAHGTYVLQHKYADVLSHLDRAYTYLFEIVYPGDHHCVSYHGLDDIILLAVINIDNGQEQNINDYAEWFTVTKTYDGVTDWQTIRDQFDGTNREGFVIRFSNGYRMKLKYEEYFRIHFLRSNLGFDTIYENFVIAHNEELYDTLENGLDEENRIHYHNIIDDCRAEYAKIEMMSKAYLDGFVQQRPDIIADRKRFAEHVLQEAAYPGIVFSMHDGKNYERAIWKIVYKAVRPRYVSRNNIVEL